MTIVKSASAALVGATLLLGAAGSSLAADMPIKAAPVPKASPWVLDVHGYADLTFASTRVTNGGLYLYNRGGPLTQVDVGLSLDIYKNSAGFINSFSVFGGVWNEFWNDPNPGARVWQEMDMWVLKSGTR